LKLSGSLKYKLDKTVNLTVSATLPISQEGGPVSSQKLIPVPFGYQVDFTLWANNSVKINFYVVRLKFISQKNIK